MTAICFLCALCHGALSLGSGACGRSAVAPASPFPPLTNVQATVRSDSVRITFAPFAGAKDYRVFVVPKESDIIQLDDGTLAVKDAIYRCAGDREVPALPSDDEPQVPGGAMRTLINHDVRGFVRTLADATLGYGYPAPGPGSVPVYALGNPAPGSDNACYFHRWNESRVKKYVASAAERDGLLAAGWRDDGIAFWVPAPGRAGTRTILTAVQDNTRFYFGDGPERDARSGLSPVASFALLSAPSDGTEPVMRVFYDNGCGNSHDELVAGRGRFDRAVRQGNQPIFEVLWTNLKEPTRLAVEALDKGCPFQGFLSPKSIPPQNGRQGFMTIEEIRAASPHGEVFINGQHAATTSRPRVLARAYIDVAPQPPEPMDFYDGFSDGVSPGPLKEIPGAGFQTVHLDSPNYDVTFYSIEFPQWAIGQMVGELWVAYADWASDTNGKFRLTPKRKATLSATSFLHVTMGVDIVTTGRRYPQLLVSDRDPPVQDALTQGSTFIVQTFGDHPPRIDLELCDHRAWDVNNQCPHFQVDAEPFSSQPLSPHAEVAEHAGVDRRTYFDLYLSTTRAYVFLDGEPWACANLPATGGMPAGPVSVTFGDVLYHSGIDVPDPPYGFHHDHMYTETRRHFDDLGFRSGVAAPAWDESRLPCSSTLLP